MKLQIREATCTVDQKTFVDKTKVEIGWKHGDKGCMVIVDRSRGWKGLLKVARQTRKAFLTHLERTNG